MKTEKLENPAMVQFLEKRLYDAKRLFAGYVEHKGPKTDIEAPLLPIGRSVIMTGGHLSIAFVSPDGIAQTMFVLDPGRHIVRCPEQVSVVVECDKSVKWSVRWPGRFNPADPTRVDASLVRPRTQKEEMQDFVNEMIARTVRGVTAQQLREGKAEIDVENDNYDEDMEDDYDSPLSAHQMELIMEEMNREIVRQHRVEAKKAPPRDPNTVDLVDGLTDKEKETK